jgi:hypothetical protein
MADLTKISTVAVCPQYHLALIPVARLKNGFTVIQFFENLASPLCPDKRFRPVGMDQHEFLKVGDDLSDSAEHPALDPLACQFREPTIDQIQPGGTWRREM